MSWSPFFSGTVAQNHLLSLACLLLIRGVILIFAIFRSGIGLGPDEAQYWLWSRHLDFGYYSKPPGIALEIFLGTQLFGDTVLGVRFGALVIGSLLPIAVYVLAGCCGLKPTTAFWAGVVMAICPAGVLGSFLATTDAGYVLLWTVACAIVAQALRLGQAPNYRALGAVIAFGALFKWPIYLFWLLLLPFCLLANRLRSWQMIQGIAISLLGLVPSLIWNQRHDWVTFRHVASTIWEGTGVGDSIAGELFKGNFLEFLGAQIALLSPVFFGLFVCSMWVFLQRRRRLGLPLFFCGYVSVTIFCIYMIASLFMKMQGNWAVYAYPTAIVLITWYACEWIREGKSLLLVGGLISCLLTTFAFSLPMIQAKGLLPAIPIDYRLNPFRVNLGWEPLETFLKEDGYDPTEHFLASDRYQTSAILSGYSEGHQRSYVLNLGRARKNQFSVWPNLADERAGQTGFFVAIDDRSKTSQQRAALVAQRQEQLSDYFRTVEYLGERPLFQAYGRHVKHALIFRCCDYNSNTPADPNQY